MKRVFDNHMVAHVWAQQTQSDGRSHNGNFWFRDATLYSYRTPIANIVLAANGTRAALISSNKYSVTTGGKHIGPAHRAASHLPTFSVPFIGVSGGAARGPSSVEAAHPMNLASITDAYEARKGALLRKRDLWRGITEDLQAIASEATDYAETFGLPVPSFDVAGDAMAIEAARAAREAKRNTPAAIAKRERENERKAAKVREAYRRGDSYYGRELWRIEAVMTEEDKAARGAVIRARQAEQIAKWYAGDLGYCGYFDAECGGAALRIRGDELETSHNASVPLAHAIKAFKFLKLCRERGEGWHANGHSIRVGHFTVSSIEPDGSFRAGCHYIRWPEIERVAILAGVFEAPATTEALELTRGAA